MPLEEALDASWQLLAEIFPEEVMIKQSLAKKYWPGINQISTKVASNCVEAGALNKSSLTTGKKI